MTRISRSGYMANAATHRQYYAQFVTPYIKQAVIRAIGKSAIIGSTGDSFNDIPLRKWDAIIGWSDFGRQPIATDLGAGPALRDCGDIVSAAGLVCILKEAARQIKETEPA